MEECDQDEVGDPHPLGVEVRAVGVVLAMGRAHVHLGGASSQPESTANGEIQD